MIRWGQAAARAAYVRVMAVLRFVPDGDHPWAEHWRTLGVALGRAPAAGRGRAALGCRATAATGGPCAPGASRPAGRGEDCTGPRAVSQGAARGVEVEKGRAPGFRGRFPPGPGVPCDPGGRFPGSLGRERETPAGGGIPREKGNMTDERIDPIGSVTTGTYLYRVPAPAAVGRIRCGANPAMSGSGLWTGRPGFPMQWLGESAS